MEANIPKNALVTGAGRRIGRAIVLDLARAGWSVAVHFHRSEDEANALVPEVLNIGGTAVALNADLGDEEQASNLLPLAEAAIGKITLKEHILITIQNTATSIMGLLLQMTEVYAQKDGMSLLMKNGKYG